MTILGGSAGGYIVLCAMAFHDVFAAGSSRYGVADIVSLMAETHKFESGYDAYLIGSVDTHAAVFAQRSPINHADHISQPLMILQGLDDPVVPPSQAEAIVAALQRREIPYAYITFAGEAHGFRKAESIAIMVRSELAFFRRVLGIHSTEDAAAELVIANEQRLGATAAST